MNVPNGGPHILLFERDQQLMALLSGELALAGYEVHTARTAVEVFDAIARFPIRLVMVNLAQAQAGRREFWVALDAQRRGRGVQVFTFRCANVGGYGPEDPEERIDAVLTDLEVEGMMGVVRLVEAVRARVPGSATSVTSARQAATVPVETQYAQSSQGRSVTGSQPAVAPAYAPAPIARQTAPIVSNMQPLQGTLRPQPSEVAAPPRPADPPRSGHSTFTDKIRAVIYPSSRSFSSVPEAPAAPYTPGTHHQHPDVQPRPQPGQRFVEAQYPSESIEREEMIYQSPGNALAASQTYAASAPGTRQPGEESGLDQLSRMLRESQPELPKTVINGNIQHATARPGVSVDPQELQDFRSQMMQAARLDEAQERTAVVQPRPGAAPGPQLRASPIQDMPFEQEVARRRGAGQSAEESGRPAMAILQPTQAIQQTSALQSRIRPQVQFSRNEAAPVDSYEATAESSQVRQGPPEMSVSSAASSQIRPLSPLQEVSSQSSGALRMDDALLREQIQSGFQQSSGRRPEVRTSDDLLLDIVKSLPPMAPAPQPPPQPPQVLNGRATRSLGSVLLEGHLVPEERLQVAQHVQRMLRGVDLNYQLGEILLMFKLLSPDQLLAASLVSYGMISPVQITSLGRIRQELHAMGLEYDLESLLVLFRILTPEQLREVRASWSS
jgi:CheY-like chemotaxis protein